MRKKEKKTEKSERRRRESEGEGTITCVTHKIHVGRACRCDVNSAYYFADKPREERRKVSGRATGTRRQEPVQNRLESVTGGFYLRDRF